MPKETMPQPEENVPDVHSLTRGSLNPGLYKNDRPPKGKEWFKQLLQGIPNREVNVPKLMEFMEKGIPVEFREDFAFNLAKLLEEKRDFLLADPTQFEFVLEQAKLMTQK